ncbi:glycerophosphodiester phosphodiesterase family protein [Sphingobacterium oryzagri]|uniref:Glycerophosphodiester phosphodiesterase family protein n=1 Tax=Sphingobacterium oryzagri TaxID=3025669 RepID=A0ABY7WG26_9SPHI|nr:glycerophosphodiester phosphodiesterase family protein [Sphingobacterium sp. KACC 22765]WDF67481.1 glycerophosphodiester phosphodiesterase family protein [Sphingobacterium sp. KACC 22765]
MHQAILFTLALLTFSTTASAQQIHRLAFANAKEMHNYFKVNVGAPIISGHRGTKEAGMPENSIAAMEHVLKHTQAIFEVDPRLTKDSVAVMHHDARLDRTTTGSGLLREHLFADLKDIRLKDAAGHTTNDAINTLDDMIAWAKGKTILNLDKKDLPLAMTAAILAKYQAYAWVWVTVHNVDEARFFLESHPEQFISMHIKSKEALADFVAADLPIDRMIVYIGSEFQESNTAVHRFFTQKGVMCMISTAPTYDKLTDTADRAKHYRAVFDDGASILESDLPIEVSKALVD